MQDMNSKIGSVYAEMGEQIHQLSDDEEEMLQKSKPQAKGGLFSNPFSGFSKSKAGGGGGPPKSKFAGK